MSLTQLTRRAFVIGAAFLATRAGAKSPNAHSFAFVSIDEEPLPLETFRGKTVLVVNTASRCGFTRQYDALQAVYDQYRDQGLVVLGVPSDDFGGQELDTEAEIKNFCRVNFDIDFPMTAVTRVRGSDAHPFYVWAHEELGPAKAPRWNFHKYLVAPDGALIDAFPSQTEPDDPRVISAIERALDVS